MRHLKEYENHDQILKDLDSLGFMHDYEVYIKLVFYYPNNYDKTSTSLYEYVFPIVVKVTCNLDDNKENKEKIISLAFDKAKQGKYDQEEITGDLEEMFGKEFLKVFSKDGEILGHLKDYKTMEEVADELGAAGQYVIEEYVEHNHPGYSPQDYETEMIVREIFNNKTPRKR
jgi:hypothetical protein